MIKKLLRAKEFEWIAKVQKNNENANGNEYRMCLKMKNPLNEVVFVQRAYF